MMWLLQQDMVWAVIAGHADNKKLLQLISSTMSGLCFAGTLTVNGIEITRVLTGVEIIDYAGLVELTVKNPVIHTWC